MTRSPRYILPILFATLLIDMIGIGMLIPILPTLFTEPTSPDFMLHGYGHIAQFIIAGLMTALFGVMQFFAAPVLGELSDVYGRKRLLTLGVGVLACSQMLFATGIALHSLLILFASRAIAGVAGANFSIAQAAIADITEPQHRARNFGLIGSAVGLGFIVGPFLGGQLAGMSANPGLPFMVAGLLGVLNVLFVTFMLPETHHHRAAQRGFTFFKGVHNIKAAIRDVDVRQIYLVGFLYMLGFASYTSFVTFYLVDRFSFSEQAAGIYFAIVGVWMIITQGFLVRIVSRLYRERTILRYTLPTLAFVLILYPFVPHVSILYALMPFIAVSVGLTSTSIPSLISKGVSKERQGAALGINGSLMALSQATAPLIAGVLSGYLGTALPFIVGGVSVLGAWYILMRTHLHMSREQVN